MNRTISKALSNPIVGILVIAIGIIVLGFSVDDAFARRGGGRGGSRGGRVIHPGGRGSVSHHRSRARTPERSRERFQERRDVARENYDERWDRARRYAFWRTAVVGTRSYASPLDCTEVFLSGWTYYNCNGVTWRPYSEGGRIIYVVVE